MRQVRQLTILTAWLLMVAGAFSQSVANGHYRNPITLNGKPVESSTFTRGNRGILTVVTGNPATSEAHKIPFRVYLKRGAMTIYGAGCHSNQLVTEIEIGNVLAMAKHGDDLIIEPVHPGQSQTRQIIHVVDWVSYLVAPNINWLFPRKPGDGC
ncbi:hypothetical protein ACFSUS_10300 [Spirosoma soli]|uniref:Uncharacterized protein n=1 Tax=Spirosoma soli TaxID=1770529 RepID=A0ABW5M1V7_9BACT